MKGARQTVLDTTKQMSELIDCKVGPLIGLGPADAGTSKLAPRVTGTSK